MPETLSTSPSFFESLPGSVVVFLALIFLAIWVFSHVWKKMSSAQNVALPFVRVLLGTVAIWFIFQFLSLFLTLATPWSWWGLALLGSVVIEGVVFFYRLERKVAPVKISRAITALRIGSVALVLLILAEPVLERYIQRALNRIVVLLVDQSESMDLSDPQRSTSEWIELGIYHGILKAKAFGPEGKMTQQDVQHKTVDEFFALLDPQTRASLEALQETKRSELAKDITFGDDQSSGLLALLNQNYDVRLVEFAATADPIAFVETTEGDEGNSVELVDVEADLKPSDDWKRLTQLTGAIEYPLVNIPPDQLAGVVVISDFRDTARGNPESPAYQLASRSVPVFPVVVGSENPRHDLAVTSVDAPESIFKGERLSVDVNLKLYGVAGQEVKVKFLQGDTVLDEQLVQVPEDDDQYRSLIEFKDEPEMDGILAYSVRVQEMEDEVIHENNRWDFQTAVSEDRTNVLLVDTRPRWEFRYLRNLFYGRDKSVHLQYVLTEPDGVGPQDELSPPRPKVVASASREFGDAEATDLPETREEWRKFDVIILGDVSPEYLTPQNIKDIEYCVRERGAALIVISGWSYMPHKFKNADLAKLLPVTYTETMGPMFYAPETAYSIVPTLEGRRHPIMQLGSSVTESDQVWENQPLMKWRFDSSGVKPGATILAYAEPPNVRQVDFVTADQSPADTAARIREMNEVKQNNSLIVIQSYGLGKVMMLNYDRTWRLRYRIGDTLHHRFWGKVMTWGAGENLRAGNEFIRLGTDGITYTPEEKIKVTAQILQADYRPVTEEAFDVDVYHDGAKISSHTLQYRPESQGMYDVEIGPFKKPGTYPIRLVSSAKSKVKLEGSEAVETEFRVATALNPVEWTEFSADGDTAARIAKAGKGEVVPLTDLQLLEDAFGPSSNNELERADITLWDHWLLFLVLISMITAEWLLRRKGGLL
ncbi:DMT family transporter [Kiritimatiellota bacterium B12222]|nr:DMT family transporter [Kiritimatiellota bacterium B12222]